MTSSDEESSVAATRPRRIIDRSVSIMQREEELGWGVVVSVFGECLDNSAQAVLATITSRFEL
jgi:hypothetical protein